MRALLHPIEEVAIAPALQSLEVEILHLKPGRVEAFPGFAGYRRALGARVLASLTDQRPDAPAILRLERHIADDGFMVEVVIELVEAAPGSGRNVEDRLEMQRLLVDARRQQGHAEADIEHACGVLRPLHAAG